MLTINIDDHMIVEYWRADIGHTFNVKFLYPSKEEKR